MGFQKDLMVIILVNLFKNINNAISKAQPIQLFKVEELRRGEHELYRYSNNAFK